MRLAHGFGGRRLPEGEAALLLLWVRQGKLQAYALSGTKRRIWRFRKEDLDAALLSKPVVICKPLPVRSGKGAAN